MKPVIPVKTLAVILFGHILEVVENHKEISVNTNTRHIRKKGSSQGRVLSSQQFLQPCSFACGKSKLVNDNSMPHKGNFINIKGTGQGFHVNDTREISRHNEILVTFGGVVINPRLVIISAQKLQLLRSTFQSSNHAV